MTTPFSVIGFHSIVFSALLSTTQKLGYTDEDDIYDHLKKDLKNHTSNPFVIMYVIPRLYKLF
jgi:hypothetical protein